MSTRVRRQPGEHGADLITQDIVARSFYYAGLAVCGLAFIAVVWIIPATSRLSPQWSVTLVGLLLFAGSVAAFARTCTRGRYLVKGVVGERLTADALDSLRGLGYEVFHDLPDQTPDGRPCNIDHVVVGAGGVFVIETKFRKEAFNGKPVVVLSDRVEVAGYPVEPDPRAQALATMASVRGTLGSALPNEPDAIRAVVLFPRRKGGGVDNGFRSPDGVWVLTPAGFVTAIRRQRAVLGQHQVREISTILRVMGQRDLELLGS